MSSFKNKVVLRDSDNEEEKEEGQGPKEPIDSALSLKLPKFSKGDMKHKLLEDSSFSVIYPKYKEEYLRSSLPLLIHILKDHGIKIEINAGEGRMTVLTTKDTWDPYIIVKARDLIRLLSRSVPVEEAIKVLNDDVTSLLVSVKHMVRTKKTRYKRLARIVGPNGTTLKALELLTKCYITVQGTKVAIVGPHKGVVEAERIVVECMKNIHPVYGLKALMIKKKLMENPEMSQEDWTKLIPTFTKTKAPHKQKRKRKKKQPYTPFPPPVLESKLDKEIAEGKYFLANDDKKSKLKRKKNKDIVKKISNKEKRVEAMIPPIEESFMTSQPKVKKNESLDLEELKKKTKKLNKSKLK